MLSIVELITAAMAGQAALSRANIREYLVSGQDLLIAGAIVSGYSIPCGT